MVGSSSTRARAPIVLAALVLAPLGGFRAAGTAPVLGPETFESQLQRAGAIAAVAATHPTQAAMAAVRSTIGLPAEVRFPAGTVTVQPDPLLQGLSGSNPADFRLASARIAALEAGVRAALGAIPVDEIRLRSALGHALAGVSTGLSLGQRIQAVIAHLLGWLGSRLAHVHGAGSLVAWLVVAGVLVGLLVLARSFGLGLVPEHRLRPPLGATSPVGPAEWRRLAEVALARGDRVGAVRCLYHAIAASLDARGAVAAAPALTAGEFRAAARVAVPVLAEPVAEATRVFERAVYGLREPHDDEVEAVARAEQAVRTL